VTTSDAQVKKLMKQMQIDGRLGRAAERAGMDRKTARKYVATGKCPSELKVPRGYRTRPDPIDDADWAWTEAKLRDEPAFESKTLFEMLQAERPGVYSEGQLRTFQRRVRLWRATKGPDKAVFFAQEHRPGEAAQTDFTHGKELGVTILGVAFAHLLCHFVLPYSNWEWVTVCMSESIASIRRGVQAAIFRLGHHPTWHQTDNSTAATHELADGDRGFNGEYVSMVAHFGMKPRTIGVGAKEQNGDVEASNGSLKRRIAQRLLVRGSSEFESIDVYEHWLAADPVERANAGRRTRLAEEIAVMPSVHVARLPEFKEHDVVVTSWSTIRVAHNAYSVPSRMIGQTLRVRIYERRIEVYIAQTMHLEIEKLSGRNGHRINYRHVIWSLVQKPGAFARHKYREEFFPTLTFRRAYDAITADAGSTAKDLAYLRILVLAAATVETDVEMALVLLLDARRVPDADAVKEIIGDERELAAPPVIEVPVVDLQAYDELLTAGALS
jgi:transposase InsO family protein